MSTEVKRGRISSSYRQVIATYNGQVVRDAETGVLQHTHEQHAIFIVVGENRRRPGAVSPFLNKRCAIRDVVIQVDALYMHAPRTPDLRDALQALKPYAQDAGVSRHYHSYVPVALVHQVFACQPAHGHEAV